MTLFKNATLVEFDPPRIREGADLLVDGDTIKQVGKNLSVRGADKVIDLGGKLLFPGIVCSHNHFYSGLARGIMAEIGPTPDFVSVLKQLWWRLDRGIDRDILRSSGLICSLDAIRCGTTSVIDHHASPNFIEGSLNTLKETFEETGLRGVTCYEVTDRHGEAAMNAGIEENISFARQIDAEKKSGSWSGLTEAHIGGHAPCTLPDGGLKGIADACSSTGRGFHVHVAEDRWDVSHSHINYSKDIAARLDDYGLLTEKTLLVHGVFLSDDEVNLINKRNTFLVHNSRSNMNNHVGYNSRLAGYKNLALGTDGIGSDMFSELQTAYFKHKDEGGPWWPGDFLSALGAGNRIMETVFKRPFGRLEAGYTADLVVADYLSPTPLSVENLAGHMVFGMGQGIVESVMIDGRFVMEERRFPQDASAVYRDAREQAARLWERMNSIEV